MIIYRLYVVPFPVQIEKLQSTSGYHSSRNNNILKNIKKRQKYNFIYFMRSG